MNEIQKEFSSLSAEVKEMDNREKKAINKEKYKDYLYKVGTYGHTLEDAEKISEITDEDRETAHVGLSGLVYTDYEGKSQTFRFVMMKSKEEYARVTNVLLKLSAVQHLSDDNVKDKEKYIKILLGETDEKADASSATAEHSCSSH
jgi:hypothetical protein